MEYDDLSLCSSLLCLKQVTPVRIGSTHYVGDCIVLSIKNHLDFLSNENRSCCWKFATDLWIYGHTHGNVSDFNIGKTSLVTNQLGYLRSNEHALFNNGKTFELWISIY